MGGGGCIVCVFGICVFMCHMRVYVACMGLCCVCVMWLCVCVMWLCVCVFLGKGGMCLCLCVHVCVHVFHKEVKGEDICPSMSGSMRFLNLPVCFSKKKKKQCPARCCDIMGCYVAGVSIDGALCC